jgi:hypothetical protein
MLGLTSLFGDKDALWEMVLDKAWPPLGLTDIIIFANLIIQKLVLFF